MNHPQDFQDHIDIADWLLRTRERPVGEDGRRHSRTFLEIQMNISPEVANKVEALIDALGLEFLAKWKWLRRRNQPRRKSRPSQKSEISQMRTPVKTTLSAFLVEIVGIELLRPQLSQMSHVSLGTGQFDGLK